MSDTAEYIFTHEHELPRRMRLVHISPSSFAELLREGSTYRVTIGLPADARVLDVHFDPRRDELLVKVESQMFPPVGQCCELDWHQVAVERLPAA